MAQQEEEGWPLGLHPLNMRVGLVRNSDLNGSLSFNTLITRSQTSSTDSSSDLDTQSTGSFFPDKSITLGSLIGISNIMELSRRSTRTEPTLIREKKSYKSRTWLFSLCSKFSTDAVSMDNNNTQSLAHFLEAERGGANIYRRNNNLQSPNIYGPDDDFSNALTVSDPNSLFLEGHVVPPQSSPCAVQDDDERRLKGGLVEDNGYGTPLLFSCLCGNLTQ